ncbi:MAG TPA: hypothetical protein VHB27_10360 [Rhodopila sp.]|uniref:hypothetical protein n=1 Tax=Rhodopila sp. TaxID=2480087 RepID=UPI002CAC958E|nr:hypothetical protein [Rhodopila sp.]HVY15624.1 hypothetical protein [Rhodopila sp.]
MSTGNLLYLLMCIGMFTVFAIVLAYESWQQSKLGPDMLGTVRAEPKPATHFPNHAAHA